MILIIKFLRFFIDDRTQATVIEDRHQDFRKLKKDYPQIQITQVVNEYNAYNYKVKNYSRVYETNYLFLELEEIDMTGNLLELHKFMVDNSDKIISCYNTANDIPFMEIFNYAISNQKEIINFFEFI